MFLDMFCCMMWRFTTIAVRRGCGGLGIWVNIMMNASLAAQARKANNTLSCPLEIPSIQHIIQKPGQLSDMQ